eukprot:TRINITY_DN825_c0_g1_i22.p2 TRINITY_DN825_c0_g1~~TRINITY_DN825_c0_g1_i22.p2  ORF type:complete len:102 (+),score=30.70 TRINITY_DN825_c0_g1_i22:839-1144(+)
MMLAWLILILAIPYAIYHFILELFRNMRVTESENQNQQLTPESDSQQGSQQAPQPETNIEDLDVDGVVALLRKWDLEEIEAKFREKNINGRAVFCFLFACL